MTQIFSIVIIVLLVINLLGLLVLGMRINGQSVENKLMDRRLNRLEVQVENLPTHNDLRAVVRELNEMLESVASMHGQVAAMTQTLKTIQEHLLDREKHQ